MQTIVTSVCNLTFSGYNPVIESLRAIRYLPLNARSTVNKLCQTQTFPTQNSRVYNRLHGDLMVKYRTSNAAHDHIEKSRLLDIIFPFEEIIESQYLSGFLSMYLRNIGYADLSSVKAVFENNVSKEIVAAVERYRPAVLRWCNLLSPFRLVRHTFSLGDGYMPEPLVNDFIFQALSMSKSSLSRHTFYPEIGKKTVGRKAQQESERILRNMDIAITRTLLDSELYYHKTGRYLAGLTEMRWSWKYNVLKPRVYYARGPDVYYSSR